MVWPKFDVPPRVMITYEQQNIVPLSKILLRYPNYVGSVKALSQGPLHRTLSLYYTQDYVLLYDEYSWKKSMLILYRLTFGHLLQFCHHYGACCMDHTHGKCVPCLLLSLLLLFQGRVSYPSPTTWLYQMATWWNKAVRWKDPCDTAFSDTVLLNQWIALHFPLISSLQV